MSGLAQSQELSSGATTLVMRSTHSKVSHQEIMTLLNVLTAALRYEQPMYDFVYMPWGKLIFVNFVDHNSCQAHFEIIQRLCNLSTQHPGVRYVAEAFVQGLEQNLAYFLVKSGWEAVNDPRAPRVYEDGIQISLVDALHRHVTHELVEQMEAVRGDPSSTPEHLAAKARPKSGSKGHGHDKRDAPMSSAASSRSPQAAAPKGRGRGDSAGSGTASSGFPRTALPPAGEGDSSFIVFSL
mmetsp:Transcript_30981/g.72698  ORF Transcript_30981/g.72698 Transcript_30981/m.72698 type:complete len:239 (+) Transcript_30981:74-790(+)